MSRSGTRAVLIVCHGPGRGRLGGHVQRLVADARSASPGLRVSLHETGSGAAPALDGADAVFFWLADPLRESYPDCYAEAKEIERQATSRGLTVLNPPDALSHSAKSVQAERWRAAGIPAAPAHPFRNRAELAEVAGVARYPLIIRSDTDHGARRLPICNDRAQVLALAANRVPLPGVAISFIDTRASYPADSVFGRYYHKKRVCVFGDVVVPNHVVFSPNRIVGMGNSTFRSYARFGGRLASLAWLRRWDRAALRADRVYWQREPEAPDVMRRAVRALGVDFAAIDYSSFADGRVVLWEANPYFDLPPWRLGYMPRQRQLERRLARVRSGLVQFLDGQTRMAA